ncbi:hypothetical protein [Pseudomonas rhodesiae]|jgi:hypothetical protein|uniref:hypothetical protein n=1 Tax=Pseudomonas rhodesiae TaxID=76760 RepID=UPI00054BFFA8|nr:hypothetical protein [Pseudomonas rhodesiae]NMZ18714.1 hypothetical protein [Pseudomonas rhodesiae]QVN05397.1 hypothetical protein JYG35_17245 [Pseudomonas rhodesiae]WHT77900.1 hypothetical protein QMY54_02677 [Pseudomonas rhodesiae]
MDLFFVYVTLLIILTFVILGLMLFAEHRKLEELESYFSKNTVVREHKRKWGRNQRFARFHRMGLMIDILSMPKRYVKKGLVTEAELGCVPLALKRWALWPYRLCHIWALALIIGAVWRRWGGIEI